jgi:hypothetical protein
MHRGGKKRFMLLQFSMAEVKKKICFRDAERELPLASPPQGYRLAEAEEAPRPRASG